MKRFYLLIIAITYASISYANNTNDEIDINSLIIHENRYDKLIDLASSYMNNNSEFAFNCVYKAHKIAQQTNNNEKLAESNIIMGDIFYNNNSYSNAISYYNKAISNYITQNDFTNIARLYTRISNIYQDKINDTIGSSEAINNAIRYAYKSNDMNEICEVHMVYGDICVKQNKLKEANNHYEMILRYKIKDNNHRKIARVLTCKAHISILNNEYNNALFLIDSSLTLCDNYNLQKLEMVNYGYKAEAYDSLKMYEEAIDYYKKAIYNSYTQHEFNTCGEYMFKLGSLKKRMNNRESAIGILKILSDSTEKYKMYDICSRSYYQLSKCYAEEEDYESAYNYFNKYDIYYDSANIQNQEKKMQALQTSYLISLNINELKLKEDENNATKNSKTRTTLTISGAILLLIMLVTFVILFYRNKILYHKNREKAYEQQMKIDKMENDLMEIQLKNNKESLINLALHLKSYLEFINPLKNEMKEIIDSPDEDVKSKVKNMYINMQNNSILFNNTDNLNKLFNDIYKDFLDRLEQKYPVLTKSEKRLCAMLYVNMSSKEIAIITNTTLRSVETSRYRLRKKFNLSRDEDMVNFLKSI